MRDVVFPSQPILNSWDKVIIMCILTIWEGSNTFSGNRNMCADCHWHPLKICNVWVFGWVLIWESGWWVKAFAFTQKSHLTDRHTMDGWRGNNRKGNRKQWNSDWIEHQEMNIAFQQRPSMMYQLIMDGWRGWKIERMKFLSWTWTEWNIKTLHLLD